MEDFSGVSRERCDSVEGESNTPVSKKRHLKQPARRPSPTVAATKDSQLASHLTATKNTTSQARR